MSTFCNIFLKPRVGKEYAAIGYILNIGDLATISCSIKSCDADAKNLCSLLTSDKPFQQQSSNLLILLVALCYFQIYVVL